MKRTTKAAAVAGLVGVVAVPVSIAAFAAPAYADRDRTATCGIGVSELSVDREDGGFEVSFDTDRVKAGSTWKVVMRHDGKLIAHTTRTADREGEYDVERYRPDTAGKDVFTVKAKNTRTGTLCSHTITMR